MNKEVYIKIKESDGTPKGVFFEFTMNSFRHSLYSGVGDQSFDANVKFDSLDSVQNGDVLETYVASSDYPDGLLIYSGVINKIDLQGAKENVQIYTSGFYSDLSEGLYRDGTLVRFKQDTQDLSEHIKDTIDRLQAVNTESPITYTSESIESASVSRVLNIFSNTYEQVIKKIMKESPVNFIYFLDAQNVFHYKAINASGDHFILRDMLIDLQISKTTRHTKSDYLFYNGLQTEDVQVIYKAYNESTAPVNEKWETARDSRVSTVEGADDRADRFFSVYGKENVIITATIKGNQLGAGYNIESIRVGDTVAFRDFNFDLGIRVITDIEYFFDYIVITTENVEDLINRKQAESNEVLNQIQFEDGTPENFTT